jgi:hypothetical protein
VLVDRHVREADEAVVAVSNGQFQLTDYKVIPDLVGEFDGSLIVPLVGGAAIATGISAGPVHVRAEALDGEPGPEPTGWEEIAEIGFDAPAGSVRVVRLFDDPVPEIPPLTSGPGRYRLRVHARGRRVDAYRVVDASAERYLLQVWPDSPS